MLRSPRCSRPSSCGWMFLLAMGYCWLVAQNRIAHGAVVRFEITQRKPYAAGRNFGAAGAYEWFAGTVHYTLDPALPQNETIVDLALAPRNPAGLVEFQADLVLIAPVDPQKGNHTLLYDVNNRGNRTAIGFFNGGDPGDGFLLEHGYTIVCSGWDGELLPGGGRLRLQAPVARHPDGKITGRVRCEMVPGPGTARMVVNWENHGSYRPTTRGLEQATLTVRERAADARQPLSRSEFQLHVTEVSDSPAQLPQVELEFPAGMKPGWIYELIYEAEDPLVQGAGFAAVRDLIAALRTGQGAANPLGQDRHYQFAIGFGISQSGRFLREMLHAGFNCDEAGQRVFDGLLPHVSGSGMGSFNHRFAQPTRHVNQHDHHEYVGDRFPFTYGDTLDPYTQRTDGLLRRARTDNVEPKVFQTQSAGEYWTRSGSLTHTDPLGQTDVELPANVRLYLLGGTQHGTAGYLGGKGVGELFANHGDSKPMMRALLLALQQWIVADQAPPPSVYPTVRAQTLVAPQQATVGFPQIPGVPFPEVIQQPDYQDYGPRWLTEGIMDVQPPRIVGPYRVLVPRCDADGNELDCLSPPEVQVPIGTHTGWNVRRADAGAGGELVSLGGAFIPFAVLKGERESLGDPRLSLAERYGTHADYIAKLRAKCATLVEQRYLLATDVERIIELNTQRTRPLFSRLAP